jgi:hypothetical protein
VGFWSSRIRELENLQIAFIEFEKNLRFLIAGYL